MKHFNETVRTISVYLYDWQLSRGAQVNYRFNTVRGYACVRRRYTSLTLCHVQPLRHKRLDFNAVIHGIIIRGVIDVRVRNVRLVLCGITNALRGNGRVSRDRQSEEYTASLLTFLLNLPSMRTEYGDATGRRVVTSIRLSVSCVPRELLYDTVRSIK